MFPSILGLADFSYPCAGRMFSVGGRKNIASSAPLVRLAGAFWLLASLEFLVPPSCLHVRSLQWRLLTLWSPGLDHPSLPVPLSRAVRWISLRGYCRTVFLTGFFNLGLWLLFCTDVRMCLHWVEATASSFVLVSVAYWKLEMLFHIYLLGLQALFLTLPSIPIGVAVLRVPTCDDSMVVASVALQGGTVSRFLCLLTGRLMVLFECLVLHLPLVICQGNPLFW